MVALARESRRTYRSSNPPRQSRHRLIRELGEPLVLDRSNLGHQLHQHHRRSLPHSGSYRPHHLDLDLRCPHSCPNLLRPFNFLLLEPSALVLAPSYELIPWPSTRLPSQLP